MSRFPCLTPIVGQIIYYFIANFIARSTWGSQTLKELNLHCNDFGAAAGGAGAGRGGGGKGDGDGDRKNLYRQKDHARVDRVVQNAIALLESNGHTPSGDEVKAMKEKLYAKEDALGRKT